MKGFLSSLGFFFNKELNEYRASKTKVIGSLESVALTPLKVL